MRLSLETNALCTASIPRFYDLHGGRREYVLTIACMIGKSRMKGAKIVTNLVPYGPEKPRDRFYKTTFWPKTFLD
jgi:hypothetical protein